MTQAIRLLPSAFLALSALLGVCEARVSTAYGADAPVTSETSLPAGSHGLNAGLFSVEPGRLALVAAPRSAEQIASEIGLEDTRHRAWRRRWLISVAPVLASQTLDAASSWGLRELNPVLAGPDGRFGMKATAVKFGVIGGLLGAEYLIVKKFPASAKFFTVINYSKAGVTTGLAVHNYRLPGR